MSIGWRRAAVGILGGSGVGDRVVRVGAVVLVVRDFGEVVKTKAQAIREARAKTAEKWTALDVAGMTCSLVMWKRREVFADSSSMIM